MADWTSSMQQTFEYYVVNPTTWKDSEKLENITSCTINRDSDTDTLGSATFDIKDTIEECYVRIYLITIQNGVKEKSPLGTYLVQTPSSSFDGKIRSVSIDTYTPLLELRESLPPIGYYVPKTTNIMDTVYKLAREHMRAPITKTISETDLYYDYVADINDTWLTFLRDLLACAKYSFSLDELGRVLFSPDQKTESLQPVWTYTDDNSSILYPDFTMNHDLYGIPNVVEVVYSKDNAYYFARVTNDDPNSPTSIIRRGREIVFRDSNPSLIGDPNDNKINEYATNLLKEKSNMEYTITYTHGYCPVRLGDCVRLNYKRAGVAGIKAKVVSQTIKCVPGCPVTEKAIFTNNLWR